jgi:hypothetical protein
MRAVKYAPKCQVVGSVFKLVFGPCRHEQDVARLKRVTLAVVKEESAAANDEVKLVLWVGRLLHRSMRDGKGYIKGATPQDYDSVLARRTGNTRLGLGEAHHATTIRLVHFFTPRFSSWIIRGAQRATRKLGHFFG